jgi:hypothetical protein
MGLGRFSIPLARISFGWWEARREFVRRPAFRNSLRFFFSQSASSSFLGFGFSEKQFHKGFAARREKTALPRRNVRFLFWPMSLVRLRPFKFQTKSTAK